MKPWSQRPKEEAHLLNPAFCCVSLTSACIGFRKENKEPLPFALSFLVLPIVLHQSTRKSLPPPKKQRTSIPAWMREHPEARAKFYERLMALKPYTREALRYGLLSNWIVIEDSGHLRSNISENRILKDTKSLGGDVEDCALKALNLGRWFGKKGGSIETLLALWGIRL